MCRNIKLLFNFEPPATGDEIRASALQYVRKVSGMRTPAQQNKAAFDRAVKEITEITERLLLEELDTSAPSRSRELEAERARARGRAREDRLRAKIASNRRG
ncbi:MAG: DUF2277 domain-containing protein [Sandaracinaceae bacterium]